MRFERIIGAFKQVWNHSSGNWQAFPQKLLGKIQQAKHIATELPVVNKLCLVSACSVARLPDQLRRFT